MTAVRVAAICLALAVAACGFRLRGQEQFAFDTIYLNFPANSALAAELARNIRAGSNAQVVPDPKKAQSVLDLIGEAREREVLSVSAQGRAREFQLRYRVAFRVRDGQGRELIGPTELVVQRDVSFNESQVLAKESEEALLFRDMQTDVVQQLLRRLAAIRAQPARSDADQG